MFWWETSDRSDLKTGNILALIWVGCGKRTFSFSAGCPGRLSFSFPPWTVQKFLQSTLFCGGLGWAREPFIRPCAGPRGPALLGLWVILWEGLPSATHQLVLVRTGLNCSSTFLLGISKSWHLLLGSYRLARKVRLKFLTHGGWSKQANWAAQNKSAYESVQRERSRWGLVGRVQRRLPEEMGLLCQEWLNLRR